MKTLHQQLIDLTQEKLLTVLGNNIDVLSQAVDFAKSEDGEDQVINQALSILSKGEKFFSKFGFSAEKQEELFNSPMIKKYPDEVAEAVLIERDDIERSGLGAPRHGWEQLPFEKFSNREKFTEKIQETGKKDLIRELVLDNMLKFCAQERLAEVQKKLDSAIEEVKNITEQPNQQRGLTMLVKPPLDFEKPAVAHEKTIEGSLKETVKQAISVDFVKHYSEQLEVVETSGESETSAESVHIGEDKEFSFCDDGDGCSSLATLREEDPSKPYNAKTQSTERVDQISKSGENFHPRVETDISTGRLCGKFGKQAGFSAIRPNGGVIISVLKSTKMRAMADAKNEDTQDRENTENSILTENFKK